LRGYVVGDDLRLIHWRTTARAGELMVRRHVDVERLPVLVLLDDRLDSYRNAETFEEAIEVAASLFKAADRLGMDACLELVSGRLPRADNGPGALDALAACQVAPVGSGFILTASRGRGQMALFVSGDRLREDSAQIELAARRYRKLTALVVAPFRGSAITDLGRLRVVRAPTGAEVIALWNRENDGYRRPAQERRARTPPPVTQSSPQPVSTTTSTGRRSARRPSSPARVGAALLAVAAGGLAYQRVFTLHQTIVPLILGAGCGGIAALLMRVRARQPAQQVLLGAVATGMAATATAALSKPRPGGLGRSLDYGLVALNTTWGRILHSSLPVPPTPDRLPLIGATVSVAAVLAVLLATRPRPGLSPLAPAAAPFIIGLVLGVGGPGSLLAVTAPVVVAAGLYLLTLGVYSEDRRSPEPPAHWGAAILTVLLVIGLTVALGQHMSLAGRRHPMDFALRGRPGGISAANPLDLLAALANQPARVMFTARVDQSWQAAPHNWRLVSLDRYDGTDWSIANQPARADAALPLPPDSTGTPASVEVAVTGLPGPWVPTTGIPVAVQPSGLNYDVASLVLIDPGTSGGHTYHLDVHLPNITVTQLEQSVGEDSTLASLSKLPQCVPPEVKSIAEDSTRGLSSTVQRSRALATELASHFAVDAGATPGYSCARMQAFLSLKRGTPPQFTTTYVAMARSIGLPARVAVGFRPGVVDVATGQVTVRSTDVTAWPEIHLAELGWVAFDPVPSAGPAQPNSGAGPTVSGLPTVPAAPAARPPSTTAPPNPVVAPPSTETPATRHARGRDPVLVALGAAALIGLMALLVPARVLMRRKRRRAARRRRTEPAGQVMGAWEELLDQLAALDVRVASMTPYEVAAAARQLAPASGAPTDRLAEVVDEVVYATSDITKSVAQQAWQASDEAEEAIRAAMPWKRRVRVALFHPRRKDSHSMSSSSPGG
jgi:transglutaminase-like putative cysteine protease